MILVIKTQFDNFKLTIPFYEILTNEERASFANQIEEVYQNYTDINSNAVWVKYKEDNANALKYTITLEGEIQCNIELPNEDDLDLMTDEIEQIYFLFSTKSIVDSFYNN